MSIADDYNLQNVATQAVYADFGRRVYPVLMEMWDDLVRIKNLYEDAYANLNNIEVTRVEDISPHVYHEFFTHVYDTIQAMGAEQKRQKEQIRKDHEDILNRLGNMTEEDRNAFVKMFNDWKRPSKHN
jgi:hypothetical protein